MHFLAAGFLFSSDAYGSLAYDTPLWLGSFWVDIISFLCFFCRIIEELCLAASYISASDGEQISYILTKYYISSLIDKITGVSYVNHRSEPWWPEVRACHAHTPYVHGHFLLLDTSNLPLLTSIDLSEYFHLTIESILNHGYCFPSPSRQYHWYVPPLPHTPPSIANSAALDWDNIGFQVREGIPHPHLFPSGHL